MAQHSACIARHEDTSSACEVVDMKILVVRCVISKTLSTPETIRDPAQDNK